MNPGPDERDEDDGMGVALSRENRAFLHRIAADGVSPARRGREKPLGLLGLTEGWELCGDAPVGETG